MELSLSQSQVTALSTYVEAGDRYGYYTTLASFGVSYGNLALGVVNNDSFSGKIANNHLLLVAGWEGKQISNGQLASIDLELGAVSA